MERGSSSIWVKGVTDMFASAGVQVSALFASASLDLKRLYAPEGRFHTDEISGLWELAVSQSGNPNLGLDRQQVARHVNLDLVGYAMLASPDLRRGLVQLAQYIDLISDATTLVLLDEGENLWLTLGHTGNRKPIPRQRQEYSLLAVLVMCQWLTRKEVVPLLAELAFPTPTNTTPYTMAFGCPVRFNQGSSRLLLARADLAAPIPSVNAMLLTIHERVINERLDKLGNNSVSHRVIEEIIRRIHNGEPRREDIAASLAMADRTLERKLQAESNSFRRLLNDARVELAGNYLSDARYPLTQVAHMLGFVDQSNFFRACKRWFGLSPTAYRLRLKANPVAMQNPPESAGLPSVNRPRPRRLDP